MAFIRDLKAPPTRGVKQVSAPSGGGDRIAKFNRPAGGYIPYELRERDRVTGTGDALQTDVLPKKCRSSFSPACLASSSVA
jgi:hypothetical protein